MYNYLTSYTSQWIMHLFNILSDGPVQKQGTMDAIKCVITEEEWFRKVCAVQVGICSLTSQRLFFSAVLPEFRGDTQS